MITLPDELSDFSTFSGLPEYLISPPLVALAVNSLEVLTEMSPPLVALTLVFTAIRLDALISLPLVASAIRTLVVPLSIMSLPLVE